MPEDRKQTRPNIIFILADDMGYGDMGCNNPDSRIPTPNLDCLARQGMRFTDAHAGASLCTPSRYNILTGRYAWRTRLKHGIVWEYDSPLISQGRMTVAGLLRRRGYRTHCIGKWHLGWDWTTVDGANAGERLPFGEPRRNVRREIYREIDYGARIGGGPVDRGFYSYFGVDVPNFPPYCWFEDDHVTEHPSEEKPDRMYGAPGPAAPGWSLEAMIPEFTRRAVSLIEAEEEPFFLYFPLTSPHAPIVPNSRFIGMSAAGRYGDFVCEVDWVVGEVMAALDRAGKADDTLIIFTSDNGPDSADSTGQPGATDANYAGCYNLARKTGHYSMGPWRGVKSDVWEGGHREPFVARWPGVVPAGAVCDQLVCLGDLMATCAEITEVELPGDAAEDSVSFLPLLMGKTGEPTRLHMVCHSNSGRFALRRDGWVLIDSPRGGDCPEPDWFRRERGYEPHDQPRELFDLRSDAQERVNRYGDEPEVAAELLTLLEQVKAHVGRDGGQAFSGCCEA